jgi:hypothetical protein
VTERANPFGDLNDFAPAAPKTKAGHREVVDQVAEQHGFPSRQPVKPATASTPPHAPAPASEREKLPSRRKLTGRSEQVNIKTTFAAKKRLMEISVERDMPLGEILELALETLEEHWRKDI